MKPKYEIVNDIFKDDGLIASRNPSYKVRDSQMKAAVELAKISDSGKHAVIEGPCGFGKTYVYLSAAILKALDNKLQYEFSDDAPPKVIIVTNGISLQEQLFDKDLPAMTEIMSTIPELYYKPNYDVSFALLKGRQNFICPLKFDVNQAQIESLLDKDKFEEIKALRHTSGDMSKLSFVPDSRILALSVCQNQNDCKRRKCAYYDDCWYQLQKKKAYQSDIIICNYHLLFSAIEAPILPNYNMLIWDEAHEAASIFRTFKAKNISEHWIFRIRTNLKKVLDTTFGSTCAISYMKENDSEPMFHLTDEHIEQKFVDSLNETTNEFLRTAARMCGVNVTSDFEDIKLYLPVHEDNTTLNIRNNLISKLENLLCFATSVINHVTDELESESDANSGTEELEICFNCCNEMAKSIQERLDILNRNDGELDYAYYIKKSARKDVYDLSLERMPIRIGTEVKKLFLDYCQNIFTSATLSTGGNLEFFKSEIGLDLCDANDVFEFIGESPFDLEHQELWYLPEEFENGNTREFENYFINLANELYQNKKGGMLILTTSISAMNSVFNTLYNSDKFNGKVLKQGNVPRGQLIEQFKNDTDSVLVATKSFFTGIDVPGEALQCLLIDKLPFEAPNDPVVMHLSQIMDNCFMKYSIPKMIITLKQAVGRGVRSVNDKCLVCIADGRIATARYRGQIGKSFNYKKTATRTIEDVRRFF